MFWPRFLVFFYFYLIFFDFLIISIFLPMDISAEIGANVGPDSLDYLNNFDKRNRMATRFLYNVQ